MSVRRCSNCGFICYIKNAFVGENSVGYQVSVMRVLYCVYRELYTSRVHTKLFSFLNSEIRIPAKVSDRCSVVQSPEPLHIGHILH